MASSKTVEAWLLENGNVKRLSRENIKHGRTAHNMSSSSLRKKSDFALVSKVPIGLLRNFLANLQEVILGTKLSVLFPAIPLAIIAHYCGFGRPWVFALSLLGLTPLAERISFLTEQITFYTGPTVGGLLNATCGNATELIIAIFAIWAHKVDVVKYSLLGSILSNLLLVLGTSFFCGGLANLRKEQKYDRKQADVNSVLLLLALLCHILPLMFRYAGDSAAYSPKATLELSRVSCILMLIAYIAYLVFQLWTHREFFEAQEEEADDDFISEERPVIGFCSGFTWLVGMTCVIAVLSEYVVGTIEDITLGVALGSATQIALFVVPASVVFAWILGVNMDLDFNLLETGSIALSIIVTAFTLQDGTSHYMKGFVLLPCYIVIGASFFVSTRPINFGFFGDF